MTDAELDRFSSWCREEAADIRNYAAAFGETVEYAYLKREHLLRMRMREKFPNISDMLVDSVESECYCSDIPLDLVQINKHRAKFEYPPLGFVPPLKLREEYRAPMPGDVPEAPPPPGPSFYDWAITKLIQIRYSAAAKGSSVEQEFLETQCMFINAIQRNFPDIGPAQGLMLMRSWVHDKAVTEAPLDEERLRSIRAVTGTVGKMADELNQMIQGKSKPTPLKS